MEIDGSYRRWISRAADGGKEYVMICSMCNYRSSEFENFKVHLKRMHHNEIHWPSASYGNLMQRYAWVRK